MAAPHVLQSFTPTTAGGAVTLFPHLVQKEGPAGISAPHAWQVIFIHLRVDSAFV
jgi:hypothetical protein